MSAPVITTVHEADLVSPRQRGGRLRAYCPVHGGDHQRSLSIALEGDAAGYGYCHTCHAAVFVPELAPPGARGPSARPRQVTAEALLRPPRRRIVPSEPTPAAWQRDELAALERLAGRMRERLADERSRAYLAARGIPYDIAAAAGVGYVPADARLDGSGLAKWRDRLMFPLGSPAGMGYAGRSLHAWTPGMDENAHKALLDELADRGGPRRWEKTYPAGWYGYDALATAARVVICEGPLDRLALVAAGLDPADVVALVGTAAPAAWIPANVCGVVLALDGDAAGRERAAALRHELRAVGLDVRLCPPASDDGRGKDWAERWRVAGWDGVWPVCDALDALMRPSSPAPAPVPLPIEQATPPEPSMGQCEPASGAAAPCQGDAVVARLRARGFTIAGGREDGADPVSPMLGPGEWVIVCRAPALHELAHEKLCKNREGVIFCPVCYYAGSNSLHTHAGSSMHL